MQERENELVLGTHGRSIYVAKLDSVQLLITDVKYRNTKQAEVARRQSLPTPPPNTIATTRKEGGDVYVAPAVKKRKSR
jgi:hypothetical protein